MNGNWPNSSPKTGQQLLPMVDLIGQCQWACGELIEVTGRAAIQAVLQSRILPKKTCLAKLIRRAAVRLEARSNVPAHSPPRTSASPYRTIIWEASWFR
jgi:hypothetical protein